jgi:hypothetical protein
MVRRNGKLVDVNTGPGIIPRSVAGSKKHSTQMNTDEHG